MSDAAAAIGAPIVVKYKGKEYPLSPMDVDMYAMFERWLENRAFETIEVRKGQISEDDYDRLLAKWIEQCAAGRYRWGGPVAAAASKGKDGLQFLFFLMLSKKSPNVTLPLTGEILGAQIKEAQAKMEVVNAVPLDEGAEAEALTTP